MDCELSQRKRVQVRWRMVDGTTQAVAVRAYADAGLTQKVAEVQIPPTVNPGVWYPLQFVIPSGSLYWRGYSPYFAAWFGSASTALDVADGTRLAIDLVSSGPWVASYTQSDPNGYTPVQVPTIEVQNNEWDFFIPGEYGISTEFIFSAPVPPGAVGRLACTCSAPDTPGILYGATTGLVNGSNYPGISIATSGSEFDLVLWAEIIWNGYIYRGPTALLGVTV